MNLNEPEHFIYNGKTWTCARCLGAAENLTKHHALSHERSARHRRAVERYVHEMNTTNSLDAQEVPAGVRYFPAVSAAPSTPLSNSGRDPFMDSLLDAALSTQPSHRPSPARVSPTQSPPPPFLSPLRHSRRSRSPSPFLTPLPPSQRSRTPTPTRNFPANSSHVRHAVLDAVNKAMDLYQRNSFSDGSDNENLGDIEHEAVVDLPVLEPELSSRNRKGKSRARTGSGEWRPWPDRISCTLELASHLPRSVMSDADVEVMLWMLKSNEVSDVPSLSQIKSMAKALEVLCDIKMVRHMGSLGHTYYVIHPSSYVALDFSNPSVRKFLDFYPEDSGQKLQKASQARQWLEEGDLSQLTPMYRIHSQDFYTFEPTLLKGGKLCIPFKFFMKEGRTWFKGWKMSIYRGNGPEGLIQNGWIVEQHDIITEMADKLVLSGKDIVGGAFLGANIPSCTKLYGTRVSPHENITTWPHPLLNPWRVKANGKRVVTYPIWLYCDDTSGNRSKKWNEHNSFLMVAAGLPREQAHKESNVHFLCTSNASPPLEMLEGIVEDIEKCRDDGIWVYDCVYGEMVLVILWVMALLGDNPMQSEFACHSGLRSKFFCRSCWVKGKDGDEMEELDGAQKKSETFSGMVNRITRFMQIGKERTPSETKKVTRDLFENVIQMEASNKNTALRARTGVKDTFLHFFIEKIEKARKNLTGFEAEQETDRLVAKMPTIVFSPVWRIHGLNPHTDTLVEILHVVLLGFVKYFWRDAVERLSDDNKEILKLRLNCMDLSGLDPSVSTLRGQTLVRYAGSLVGRDFKILEQVAIFALYDLLDKVIIEAWAALAALVPLIWQPEIDNLEEYLIKLENAINYFMDCTARWTPRWFNKPKFHLLLHLLSHIRRFGPAILFATEVFESYNAVIRTWSIHSNRLAPSRDIAHHAIGLARIRHLLNGGYYSEKKEQNDGSTTIEWRTAGENVIAMGNAPSVITQRLGITQCLPPMQGAINRCKGSPKLWNTTTASNHFECPVSTNRNLLIHHGEDIIAMNFDCIGLEDFLVCNVARLTNELEDNHNSENLCIGQIREILSAEDEEFGTRILLELYDTGATAKPYYMPKIISRGLFFLAMPVDLLCSVNVQHNCASNKCDLSGRTSQWLERERLPSSEDISTVTHYNPNDLILNTAKLRDARFIQKFTKEPPRIDRAAMIAEAVTAEIAKTV